MNDKPIRYQDKDWAWCDEHIKQVCRWLLTDKRSPFYGELRMLLRTVDFPKVLDRRTKVALFCDEQPLYLWMSYRQTVTRYLKRVITGERSMRILKRRKDGVIIKYEITKPADPVPLPVPPFIKGTISITRQGVRLTYTPPPVVKPPRGERSRLLNPFGV